MPNYQGLRVINLYAKTLPYGFLNCYHYNYTYRFNVHFLSFTFFMLAIFALFCIHFATIYQEICNFINFFNNCRQIKKLSVTSKSPLMELYTFFLFCSFTSYDILLVNTLLNNIDPKFSILSDLSSDIKQRLQVL